MNEQQRQALLETMLGSDGRYRINDVIPVTEFRGLLGEDIPDIKVLEVVDIDSLTAGDDDPFYVTLKIAQSGVTSGNRIYYGEKEVNEIVQAVIEKRPTGGRGHLKWNEIASAMPANPLNWIGATRVNEFGWGKAYVTPGQTRDWLRRLGASRSEVATSIFGAAQELIWDEDKEAFRMVGFVLEYIDLASPERAGVPTLAGQVEITSEMSGDASPDKVKIESEENPMEKLEMIRQMTVEDAKLLPEAVVKAVVEMSTPAKLLPGIEKMIGELRTALGIDDTVNVVEHVKTLVTQIAETAETAVTAKINELINHAETGVKIDSVKPIVLELVQAQKPATVEAAQTAFDEVVARESVKLLLKSAVVEQSGGVQRRPLSPGEVEEVDKLFPVAG